jgi:hypothetical protein
MTIECYWMYYFLAPMKNPPENEFFALPSLEVKDKSSSIYSKSY